MHYTFTHTQGDLIMIPFNLDLVCVIIHLVPRRYLLLVFLFETCQSTNSSAQQVKKADVFLKARPA